MKTTARLHAPDDSEVAITVSATVRELKFLRDKLLESQPGYHSAISPLINQLRSVIDQSVKEFTDARTPHDYAAEVVGSYLQFTKETIPRDCVIMRNGQRFQFGRADDSFAVFFMEDNAGRAEIPYDAMLHRFTMEDGSPCGIKP